MGKSLLSFASGISHPRFLEKGRGKGAKSREKRETGKKNAGMRNKPKH
jgi:hypothetical protein